jgi:DNA invertase Pin-like site-specific DNA recombinase
VTRKLAAVPDPDRRLVAYIRVSALMGRSGDRFHSPDVQLDAIRALARQRGLNEVAVVQDIDRTGRDFAREGIRQILTMAQAGQVEVVGLYDLSRLGRNTAESLRFIATLRDLGVSVVSTTEQIDDSPEGQFMLGQFLGMAQLYSDQVGRRWASIHERRHAQGQFHGKLPLGYISADGKAVVDPLIGPIITWAFQSYLAGTVTQKQIAARLSAARGTPVRQGVVSNLLRNPFHAGYVMYRRERRPGAHEPLISQDVFDAVQRKLARDILSAPRHRAPMSWLSGYLLCDTCGRRLVRRGAGRVEDDRRPRWRCPSADCTGVGAPFIDEVENAARDLLMSEAAAYRDGVPAVLARRAPKQLVPLAPLRAEVVALRGQIGRAGQLLTAGTLTEDDYRLTVEQIRSDLVAAEARLGEAEDAVTMDVPIAEMRDAAARLADAWPLMTALERRSAAALLLPGVRLAAAAYRLQPVSERLRRPSPE